jgi:hypothetical protein
VADRQPDAANAAVISSDAIAASAIFVLFQLRQTARDGYFTMALRDTAEPDMRSVSSDHAGRR